MQKEEEEYSLYGPYKGGKRYCSNSSRSISNYSLYGPYKGGKPLNEPVNAGDLVSLYGPYKGGKLKAIKNGKKSFIVYMVPIREENCIFAAFSAFILNRLYGPYKGGKQSHCN